LPTPCWLIAPSFINLLVSGFSPSDKQLTLIYSQIIFFSLMALGPFAVLLGALFALKEFGWPAFATGAYHVGIIGGAGVGALLGAQHFGHLGLAVGVLFGAVGEIALLLPGIRKRRLYYMFVLDLRHPALRRIVKLYGPVAFSFLVTMGLVFFDQHLASLTHDSGSSGAANTTALNAATTLIQFPVGLVAAALSFAVLPTLTEHARNGDTERFKQTLLLGFRVGLLLMIPAAVGLIVLREPVVDLLFRHHNYSAQDAARTALALQNYAYQLPFVAMDQLLIAAFYARKNAVYPLRGLVIQTLVCLAGIDVVAHLRRTAPQTSFKAWVYRIATTTCLDAQRAACEAYIASQRSEGWLLLDDRYDDGGASGGTLERPALRRLLAEATAGGRQAYVLAPQGGPPRPVGHRLWQRPQLSATRRRRPADSRSRSLARGAAPTGLATIRAAADLMDADNKVKANAD